MSKEFLFIGGPWDGRRMATNGTSVVRIPMAYSDELSSPVTDSHFHECRYTLHESFAPGGRKIAFYALDGAHFIDAIQMMMDNYQPIVKISDEKKELTTDDLIGMMGEIKSEPNRKITVIGDETLDALKRCEEKFESQQKEYGINWGNNPKRELTHDDLFEKLGAIEQVSKMPSIREECKVKGGPRLISGSGAKPPETVRFFIDIKGVDFDFDELEFSDDNS